MIPELINSAASWVFRAIDADTMTQAAWWLDNAAEDLRKAGLPELAGRVAEARYCPTADLWDLWTELNELGRDPERIMERRAA